MNSTDLRDYFRDEMKDDALPYLWSDTEIYRFEDDAQKMFCRLTGGLGDGSTPEVVQLALTDPSGWVATHPSILKIRDAWRASDGRPIEILNYEDLPARGIRLDGRTGGVEALIIGMEPHRARSHPISSDNTAVIQLLVDRLPLKAITDAGDQKFEIDEQHHVALFDWMRYRAYSKQDAETFDRAAADEAKATFEAYCFGLAQGEKERAKHKTRVVTYGGI
jgi:hypothetical protein